MTDINNRTHPALSRMRKSGVIYFTALEEGIWKKYSLKTRALMNSNLRVPFV